MSALENFISPTLTRALGWTLLHSLWQGALVAGLLAGALLLLRRQRAEVRYVASASALGLVVALAGITFGIYLNVGEQRAGLAAPASAPWYRTAQKSAEAPPATGTPVAVRPGKPGRAAALQGRDVVPPAQQAERAAATQWLLAGLRYFDRNLPLLVVLWLLGLLAMSLRMLGGLLYVQRLRRYRVRPLGPVWQERLAALAGRGGVRRPVALLESALVQVPLVVGHLRPVILLPLGAVAGLPPVYLEAILAHELAHVLRRDYLVNLLQTVAEVLFFYHPAVWFVAGCVRTERENCCDDKATDLCGGDALRLARALTALAEWSHSAVVPTAPRLALAAMGGRGALLSRVRRLVQRRPAAPTWAEGIMAGALVLAGLGLLGGSVVLAGPFAQPAPKAGQTPARALGGPAQTVPADTSKKGKNRAAASSATPTPPASAAPAAPVAPADQEVAGSSSPELPGLPESAEAPAPPADPERRGSRARRGQQGLAPRSEMAPPGFRRPGTVVIMKDKKGRLTDLVVNGQHVDTDPTNGKKSKAKKSKDSDESRVAVISMEPFGELGPQAFVFRNLEGVQQPFERDAERGYRFKYRSLTPPAPRLKRGLAPLAGSSFRVLTPGVPLRSESSERDLEALRAAEHGLRTASAGKSLKADERKRIDDALRAVRRQLKAAEQAPSARVYRLHDGDADESRHEEMESRREEMRQREDELRARRAELQQRREELREQMHESEQEMREMSRSRAERSRNDHEALVNELLKDGLISDKTNFRMKLTSRSLIVGGKEQPREVFEKYRKLYESTSGHQMSADHSMTISRNSSSSDSDDMPRPPRPPRIERTPLPRIERTPRAPRIERLPRAPRAAPAPEGFLMPPNAPAPPHPPRLDTQELRSELRKDGLIGENDKSFQVQLNDSGMTVNGKRLTDDLAARYRKLLGHGRGNSFNVSVTADD